MAISAKDVMTLRQRTGVGMMECKAALAEASGDLDAAVEVLREKLKGDMEERSGREASEGAIAISKEPGAVAMIELLSETDFAARNDSFLAAAQRIADLARLQPAGEITATGEMSQLVDDLRITIKENISVGRAVKFEAAVVGSYLHHNNKIAAIVACQGDLPDELLTGICQHVTAAVPPLMPAPLAVDEAALPADAVAQQKAAFVEEARASGKPDEIIEKMITGKLRKWVDENTLVGQVYLREMEAKKPVRDFLPEGATIHSFVRYKLGG